MEKRCISCKNLLPATKEYFHINKHVNGKTYLRSNCKECRAKEYQMVKQVDETIYTLKSLVKKNSSEQNKYFLNELEDLWNSLKQLIEGIHTITEKIIIVTMYKDK